MISKKSLEAFNDQLNASMNSSFLYLSMSSYFEEIESHGFANWMRLQTTKEIERTMKVYHHIVDRFGRVALRTVNSPAAEWDSVTAVFEEICDHLLIETGRINALVELARKENDKASENFLQWFVKDQVDKEATASRILGMVKKAGDSEPALLMLDRELAKHRPPGPFDASRERQSRSLSDSTLIE